MILRDPRESVRKCSLTPLRGRAGVRFATWAPDRELEVGGRLLLHHEGEPLERAAADLVSGGPPRLLLLDCAWRRVPALRATLVGETRAVRLPPLRTAYPRRSRLFADPDQGLASIEALFAATCLLGRPDRELLEGYHFAERFLELNPDLVS